jgi:F1F0 ATPase subunit 2
VAGGGGGIARRVFFGGLWWTVRKGVSSPRPALWFLGSLLLRTGIVLAGFYFVGRRSWERLLACLLGFVIARLVVVMRLTRRRSKTPAPNPHEGGQPCALVPTRSSSGNTGFQTQRHHRVHLGLMLVLAVGANSSRANSPRI